LRTNLNKTGQSSYRNPFQPNNPKTGVREDGNKWVVVGADYASQEAVIAATICNEESLMKAIEEGCDFHSTCASMMFPDEWKRLGGDPKPKGKPEDKTLQKLRGSSKVTSFGLFYGKSNIGLGASLNIPATTQDLMFNYPEKVQQHQEDFYEDYLAFCRGTDPDSKGKPNKTNLKNWLKMEHKQGRFLPEVVTADDLIDRFYGAFPNIHSHLAACADEAVNKKFIRTSDPISRIRRFAHPNTSSEENAIRRQAMNFPERMGK